MTQPPAMTVPVRTTMWVSAIPTPVWIQTPHTTNLVPQSKALTSSSVCPTSLTVLVVALSSCTLSTDSPARAATSSVRGSLPSSSRRA